MLINENHIVSVKLFEKQSRFDVYYSKGHKKGFCRESKAPGFYVLSFSLHISDKMASDEWIKSQNLYVEGTSVYYKPHVEIRTVDGKYQSKFFENVEDAVTFIKEIQSKIKTINL